MATEKAGLGRVTDVSPRDMVAKLNEGRRYHRLSPREKGFIDEMAEMFDQGRDSWVSVGQTDWIRKLYNREF